MKHEVYTCDVCRKEERGTAHNPPKGWYWLRPAGETGVPPIDVCGGCYSHLGDRVKP